MTDQETEKAALQAEVEQLKAEVARLNGVIKTMAETQDSLQAHYNRLESAYHATQASTQETPEK